MFTGTDENGKPKPLSFGMKLLAGSGAGKMKQVDKHININNIFNICLG